jgi:hypothetical protein
MSLNPLFDISIAREDVGCYLITRSRFFEYFEPQIGYSLQLEDRSSNFLL